MTFEKLTKNMVRYKADEESGFGVHYLPKSIFGSDVPKEITLEIRW